MTGTSQAYASASSPDVRAERRRALRALLRNPLLTPDGGSSAEYALVRRHFEWLKQWFANCPAWILSIDKAVARLRKLPGDPSDARHAVDSSSGTTFTRRRYALLCLVLAALEQMDRQAVLGQIAQDVQEYSTSRSELRSAGFVFDCDNYDHRRDLMHAVRLLSEIGVLRRYDGDEKVFLNRPDATDVRYDINRHVLAVVLQSSQSPSEIEASEKRPSALSISARAAKLATHTIPATDEARSMGLQARLLRSLLDEPVLYFQDLNDEEKSYLEKHRTHLLREVHDATGLIAEVRREGIAMLDNEGDLSDIRLQDRGNDGQLILPLVQWLAGCFNNNPARVIPVPEIESQVRTIAAVHDSEWNKEKHEAETETRRTHDMLLRLRALRLLQFTGNGVLPLAAICRYGTAAAKNISAAEVHGGSEIR